MAGNRSAGMASIWSVPQTNELKVDKPPITPVARNNLLPRPITATLDGRCGYHTNEEARHQIGNEDRHRETSRQPGHPQHEKFAEDCAAATSQNNE